MTCQMMMSLGVYVLGAADAEENRRVRAHLPDCPACRAELALLRPLPSLLARACADTSAAEPYPGQAAGQRQRWGAGQRADRSAELAPGRVTELAPDRSAGLAPDRSAGLAPDRSAGLAPGRSAGLAPGRSAGLAPGRSAGLAPGRSAGLAPGRSAGLAPGRAAERSGRVRSRGRSARTWRAAAMAASVAAIAGAAGGFWLAPRAASHRPATVTLSGANPALHVTATAALTATSWGTSIELRVDGVPLNVPCRLIVRSRAGTTEITGVWDAWRTGPITVPASAGWLPSDIASLQVATTTRNLVTISGRPANIAG
jgi:hypothetical protein